ncbi:phosphate ABC transporter permease PstA [Armatimonas rosea]|uniref:Phosphate transport system permease protein PstA n=1 Tax=Armatimonas rosea TaxID=685828 RepID=A0A7W9SSR7_ARMRO|nr:phosphate ABC transporter permease PstA [Armatimonas rosea]MBB6052175.1 phosphate transport system permease protein [Armatimonas rosea]
MSLYAADGRVKLRRAQSLFMLTLCSLAALVGIFVLGLVLFFLAQRGLGHLNLKLFTVASGDGDGFAQSLRGTLQILAVACAVAVPLGIMGGIYQQESKGTFANTVRFLTDVLNGIPSIVIGIFVYAALVLPISQAFPGKGYSGWAGGVALAIMMLPLIMRTTEEMLRLVPSALSEASLGLGATRWRTMVSVVLPAARGGILTGILLAVARVAGETAPLIFTILGNEFMGKMDGQMDALPLRLFKYATDVDETHHQIAWAAALVLILMVLCLSIIARLSTRNRMQEDK